MQDFVYKHHVIKTAHHPVWVGIWRENDRQSKVHEASFPVATPMKPEVAIKAEEEDLAQEDKQEVIPLPEDQLTLI